jgi:hypothetical protein
MGKTELCLQQGYKKTPGIHTAQTQHPKETTNEGNPATNHASKKKLKFGCNFICFHRAVLRVRIK